MTEFDNIGFAMQLRVQQARLNISLTESARLIGISKATLSRLNNECIPDVITFYKCCKWLDMPMEKFFKSPK